MLACSGTAQRRLLGSRRPTGTARTQRVRVRGDAVLLQQPVGAESVARNQKPCGAGFLSGRNIGIVSRSGERL